MLYLVQSVLKALFGVRQLLESGAESSVDGPVLRAQVDGGRVEVDVDGGTERGRLVALGGRVGQIVACKAQPCILVDQADDNNQSPTLIECWQRKL